MSFSLRQENRRKSSTLIHAQVTSTSQLFPCCCRRYILHTLITIACPNDHGVTSSIKQHYIKLLSPDLHTSPIPPLPQIRSLSARYARIFECAVSSTAPCTGPELRLGPLHCFHAMERPLSRYQFTLTNRRRTFWQYGACLSKRRSIISLEPRHGNTNWRDRGLQCKR